jgi:tRNA G18 (ribose-2'-O)-methylase SpoU
MRRMAHLGHPVPSSANADRATGEDGRVPARPVDPRDTRTALDDYRALNDPDRRRRVERAGGYFVVEGRFALDALLDSPYPVRSVLVAEPKAPAVRALVAGRAPVLVATTDELAAITGFDFHRGVLAAADRLPLPTVDEVVGDARLLVVVEGVGDHENLGALFRNAAAFGVDGVLLDPTTADPLYRRSVRVSAGHVLRVPWTRLPEWPDRLGALRDRGFVIAALTPAPDARPLAGLVAERPGRVALLVGAEGPGLTAAALGAADRRVRIPIAAGVDSLNVATAAAVAFHALGPPGQA